MNAKSKAVLRRVLPLLLAGILIILAVVAWATDLQTSETESYLISTHKRGLGTLTADVAASQTFTAPENGLSELSVMVSNFNKNGKIKSGILTLWLTDADGTELGRADIECAPLRNNANVTLQLNAVQTASAGKQYTLHAVSDCTDQQGVTLRIGPAGSEGATGLILADGTADEENMLYLRMSFTSTSHGWMGALSLLLIAACLLVCLPIAFRKEEDQHE